MPFFCLRQCTYPLPLPALFLCLRLLFPCGALQGLWSMVHLSQDVVHMYYNILSMRAVYLHATSTGLLH